MQETNDVGSDASFAGQEGEAALAWSHDRATPEAMARHYAYLKRQCVIWRVSAVMFFLGANIALILLLQDLQR